MNALELAEATKRMQDVFENSLGTVGVARAAARLQLTCAALGGIIAAEGSHRADINAARAVENADACLALLYPAEEGK